MKILFRPRSPGLTSGLGARVCLAVEAMGRAAPRPDLGHGSDTPRLDLLRTIIYDNYLGLYGIIWVYMDYGLS